MSTKRKMVAVSVFLVFFIIGAAYAARDRGLLAEEGSLFRNIQIFADAITIINSEYVRPVDLQDLVHGAIRGMMNSLDGYSQFLDAESFRKITVETRGEFGGIGIRIGIRDGILTVISPLEGTPAAEKGIQPGDRIIKIEDELTREMTLDEAVDRLRGEPGTVVNLVVARDSEDTVIELAIERTVIKVESIRAEEMLEDDIGYIRLSEFQRRTPKDLARAIRALKDEGAGSIILDLRNNPGGLLDAAVASSDLLLPEGMLIVYTEGGDVSRRTDFTSEKAPVLGDVKLVVLVNEGSASAAEILAGAVQDNSVGLVIGQPTFGKGSVQTVVPLKDGSALRLTTAAYFTPAGHNLMDKGIRPDLLVRQLPLEEKRKAKDETERRREELFRKLLPREVEEEHEEETPFWMNDNQLLTAVRVIKGAERLTASGTER